MKKMLIVSLFVLSASICNAEPIKISGTLDKLPALKQGFGYSIIDHKFNYLSTMEVVHFNKYLNLEAGYAGAAENTNHKVVGVISLNLLEAGEINYPILKYVKFNPGFYVGYGNLNFKEMGESEMDYGISATLFEVKL